jgi:hypothetical protein
MTYQHKSLSSAIRAPGGTVGRGVGPKKKKNKVKGTGGKGAGTAFDKPTRPYSATGTAI